MTGDSSTPPEVRLRRVEDRDIDVFFGHQADPVAAEMAAFPSRDAAQFAAHWTRIRADDTTVLRTIVADGRVAGNIGSWGQDGQRLLGYWIGREHWGRGIATRALARFLAEEEPVRPVYAHVAVHNAGSMRVLEKAGFRRDRETEEHMPPPDDGVPEFVFVLGA
ncbi:GNAT family N-acetyltransferase [Actinoplanes nipponensis]|uniref:GNAT family N-acetyltransferase n=1 Tax=Actinoplanes nipponensis TaxID=135950 RepID=UPI001EF38E7D|nr:GNAT family N-acetyltransferase [Actinoplanes nipponensis]